MKRFHFSRLIACLDANFTRTVTKYPAEYRSKKLHTMLHWDRGKGQFSHPEVSYADKEVQVDDSGEYFAAADLPHSEQDRIVPWESPSLLPPMCSWSSFPTEPSPGLKQLVEFFSQPAPGSGRPA